MNSLRIWCAFFCILLVISAGCVLPGQTGNTTPSKDTGSQKARQTLSFGDAVSEEPKAVAAPTPEPTVKKTPAFHGSSSRTINGTGLTNSTNATSTLIDYLTDDHDYTNETAKKAEIRFWNKIATEIEEKVNGENSVTRDFALTAVSHSGTYSADQVCDLC